jgi:cytoskeletal protein CcmA (bactofilin family)
MKIRCFVTTGILSLLLSFIGYTTGYGFKEFSAGRFRVGANVTVADDEVITDELIVAGANAVISGDLREGLKVFGANIKIPGRVNGELHAFGANVILSGKFRNKVKTAGANIILSGTFEDEVEAAGAKITLASNTLIKGHLNYASAILNQEEGSQILGQITRKEMDVKEERIEEWSQKGKKAIKAAMVIFWFFSIAALIIVGLIINIFFPEHTDNIVALISETPWTSVGVGLVFLVGVPVAIVVACITVVGIPAGIIAALVYGIVLYVSRIYISVWIGRKIIGYFKKSQKKTFFWPLVLGIVTIALLGLIPFLGWLLKLFCLLISLGALWLVAIRSFQLKSQS